MSSAVAPPAQPVLLHFLLSVSWLRYVSVKRAARSHSHGKLVRRRLTVTTARWSRHSYGPRSLVDTAVAVSAHTHRIIRKWPDFDLSVAMEPTIGDGYSKLLNLHHDVRIFRMRGLSYGIPFVHTANTISAKAQAMNT